MIVIADMAKWVWRLFVPQSIDSKRRELIDTAERNLFEAKRAKEDAQAVIDYNVKRLKNLKAEIKPGAVKPDVPMTAKEAVREFMKRETAGLQAVSLKAQPNNGSAATGSAP